MYEISKAIAIPVKHITEQYSLNTMRFDPTQNSPPSLWKMRLNKRVSKGLCPFDPVKGSSPFNPVNKGSSPFNPVKGPSPFNPVKKGFSPFDPVKKGFSPFDPVKGPSPFNTRVSRTD
jgi:hypothetical protein